MTAPVETPPGAPPQPPPAPDRERLAWSVVPQVNLLPSEILDERRFRRLRAQLIGLAVGVVLLCLGGVGWAQLGVAAARNDLVVVQDQGAQLAREQARYADVPRAFAVLDQVKAVREAALGTDVLWYQFLGDLALNTPRDTELTSVVVTMGGENGDTVAPSPLAPQGLGSVNVAGTARRFPDVAAWLENVIQVHGLTSSQLQTATKGDTGGGSEAGSSPGSSPGSGSGTPPASASVKFTGSAVIDDSALSHRYDRKAD